MPKNNQQFQYNGKTVVWKKDEPKIWSCPHCIFWDNDECEDHLDEVGLPDCYETRGYYVELKTETK